jgi:hypothetical protein
VAGLLDPGTFHGLFSAGSDSGPPPLTLATDVSIKRDVTLNAGSLVITAGCVGGINSSFVADAAQDFCCQPVLRRS